MPTESALDRPQVDWRRCPKCGLDWPHPSVRSDMNCLDCKVASAREEGKQTPCPHNFEARAEADHDWRRQMEAYGYDNVAKVMDLIAAAWLAGKQEGLHEAADLAGEWRFDVPVEWSQERKKGRDIAAAEIQEAIDRLRAEVEAAGKEGE